jgi:signal transduction histidine kinase
VEALLETYSDLYDFAPVGYVSLDRSGKIHSANLTGAGLLGVDRSALISRRFKQFVARTQHSAFSSFLENVFASQLKTSCELAVQNGGAANRYFQIEAISAASGETCRVAFIDISLRKQLEKQNEIQRAELAIANIELEAFNYTVTHDLRLPLTIIHGYCQVLKDLCGCQLDEQSRGFLEEIFNGSLRMSRLITTLLKFSHVTHTEMHRKAVDLSAMAKAVVAELNLAMPGLRVRFQIDDQILGNGDPNLLRVDTFAYPRFLLGQFLVEEGAVAVLVLVAFRLLLQIVVIPTRPTAKLASIDINDTGGNALDEAPVMRDEQHCARVVLDG